MTVSRPTQVKGSMLAGFVKAIKADPTGRCEALLSDEAKKLLGETRILAAHWYPFAAYKSCFQAVCRVNAGSNPEILRQFGHKAGEETMRNIYKSVFNKRDAASVMEYFRVIGNTVYDSATIRSEMLADNHVRISFHDFDPDFAEWYLVGLGWIERTLALVIEKPVTAVITEKSWEGAPATVFDMRW